jgi:hypothetical protein
MSAFSESLHALIGGSAITLAYDDENRTADLDFIDPPKILVEKAGIQSALSQKYRIHVSSVAEINFSVPKDWRDQCRKLPLDLKKLTIQVPTVEDIILGKLARLEPKDFEDIIGLRDLKRIDLPRLVKRLEENRDELKHAEYRNNVKLMFREVFERAVFIEKGVIRLAKIKR